VIKYLDIIQKSTTNKDTTNDILYNYSNLAIALGNLRSDLYLSESTQIDASRWPTIIEKACTINFLRQDRVSQPPYSWYVSALLPKCFESINNNDHNDNEMISNASKLAFKIFSNIVDYDNIATTINNNSKISIARILALQEIDRKKKSTNTTNDKGVGTSGSQLLEIAIMNAEIKEDDNNSSNSKQDPLLQLLNSDLMLDITDKVFDSSL
jgi:hypothetical protein